MRLFRAVLTMIAIFFLANSALAQSAVREPNESWEEAARRHRGAEFQGFMLASPEAMAVPMEALGSQLANLPEWPGPIAGIREAFTHSRDVRAYDDGKHDFLRRSSWMYPDDGCFARAGHVAASLERAGLVRPGRVFAFGNLKLATPFNSRGAVYWWYHVAAAYRSGHMVVVLDPAVHYDRPLLVHEWIAKISKRPELTKVALCDTHAYMSGQACVGGGAGQERGQVSHQKGYLRSEWNRLTKLGLNADHKLRSDDPWAPLETYDLPFALANSGDANETPVRRRR